MVMAARRALNAAATLVIIALAACSGGSNAVPPEQHNVLTPQVAPTASTPCTAPPIKGLQVSTKSLTLAPGAAGQFVACTQFYSAYTITASTAGIVSFSSPVNPVELPAGLYAATIAVTAGQQGGSTTLTVKDKRGDSAQVTVTVVTPITLTCPGTGAAGATGVSCTYVNSGYNGGYTTSASTATCSAGSASNGSFTVTDSTAENCIVTLTPTSGPQSPVQATIQFVGPLTLSCGSSGVVNGTGVSCTYGDPGYTGDFKLAASSTTCAFASVTATSFTVSDSAAESCTVTMSESSAPSQSTQATITFVGPLALTCPSAGVTGAGGVTCTYTNPGYPGSYTTGATGSCSAGAASNGSFTVTDSTAETCTVTLTPSSGPESAASAQIAFSAPAAVGPLSLSCPSTGTTGATGVSCSYSNPNYAGGYTDSTSSGTCVAGTPSNGTFGVTDSAAETCTVTLTPTSGTESAVSQSITFSAPSGGGGGGGGAGCAVVKRGKGVSPRLVVC